jgi:hypothetical protein
MTSSHPADTAQYHRHEIIKKIFGDVAGRRIAVIGVGGGGDIVSTIPLCWELEQLGARPIPGGLTWKRVIHDPIRRPRTLDEFYNIRRIAHHIAVCGADTTTIDGFRHVEADISRALNNQEVLIIDPTGGSRAVLESIREAQSSLNIDAVIGVDVGGDVLCNGHEITLESPLCDQTLLHALSELNSTIIVASLGTDGEISPADFLARFLKIHARSGFLGAVEPLDAALEMWDEVVRDAKTESSRFAIGICKNLSSARLRELRHDVNTDTVSTISIALSHTQPLSLRNGARSGFTSDLTALYLGFDARTVWESGTFSTFWQANAVLTEMDEILRSRGIKTEWDEQRKSVMP